MIAACKLTWLTFNDNIYAWRLSNMIRPFTTSILGGSLDSEWLIHSRKAVKLEWRWLLLCCNGQQRCKLLFLHPVSQTPAHKEQNTILVKPLLWLWTTSSIFAERWRLPLVVVRQRCGHDASILTICREPLDRSTGTNSPLANVDGLHPRLTPWIAEVDEDKCQNRLPLDLSIPSRCAILFTGGKVKSRAPDIKAAIAEWWWWRCDAIYNRRCWRQSTFVPMTSCGKPFGEGARNPNTRVVCVFVFRCKG